MNKKKKAALVGGAVIAAIAAVLAIIGISPAQAASKIYSSMIADQTIQSRDIAAGGVGTSEVRNQSLGSGDIGSGGVGTSEIRNGNVYHQDLSTGVWKMVQNGQEAFDREDKVGLNTSRAGAGYTTTAPAGVSVLFNKCDMDGQVAISGGYRLNGHAAEAFQGGGAPVEGLSVIATEPVGVVGDEIVNTYQHEAFPQTEDGGFQANAWAVTFNNTSGSPKDVRVYATCVSVN